MCASPVTSRIRVKKRPCYILLLNVLIPLFFLTCLCLQCTQIAKPGSEAHIRRITSQITDEYLMNADLFPENWVTYGGNYAEDRYSILTQINKDNVNQLQLKWALNLGTKRGIEATPLVADGIMFLTSTWSKVHAIDTRTGTLIWTFDPEVPKYYGEKLCCDVVNRGLALYKGRVYFGTLDGRLIALDAATGKKQWEVITVDQSKYYSITGAPRIVKGQVIIGNGGAEFGVRGYITAYDAMTGEQRWRFYTVPGDPLQPFESDALKMAAKTWSGEWWKYGGGGTAWDALVFDPDLNMLYVGTGNGSPWNRLYRSDGKGDNLFLSSILAINPDDGTLIWHYQTTPGDHWDYTATQPIILADIELNGEMRHVLMQAPKNGFFYVLDRTNGTFISGEKYTYINWAEAIDKTTGRPIEMPFSRYKKENAVISPGPNGGHNWHPMAYNHKTKLVYIPVQLNAFTYGNTKDWKPVKKGSNLGSIPLNDLPTRLDETAPDNMNEGVLLAWDPIKQTSVWEINHRAFSVNSGVMTTAGDLVFQGTADGKFRAYDAHNGTVLWEYNLTTGVVAPPVTYLVDGKQFISIAVGWGGGIPSLWQKATSQINPGTVFTFELGTDSSRTYGGFEKFKPLELISIDITATQNELDMGGELYERYCLICHGEVGMTGGSIPNLAYSNETTFNMIKDIVLGGIYLDKGMPNLSDRLREAELELIKKYILNTAKELSMDLIKSSE
ncbi:PQQ-dependent dehydrogenase, methanol/ethanol family [Aestuariivivens sediminicola]|uniref:PQQ-dependent dehydrogenase, methanol/ethanol family n=1 Tax=Aestuariivivens sediminicola TaxID=2913560 RepID=UPI001F58C4FE|nr:PQQ-dependent dehydrogenase, methanol/ethanol family [Aestuariivivens sediminicola]